MPEFVYYNHAYILKNPEVPVKENLTFKKIKNTLQTNGGGSSPCLHPILLILM